ncbi:MAG: hypothetical protein ACOYVD_07115 [Bacillota bacterium]
MRKGNEVLDDRLSMPSSEGIFYSQAYFLPRWAGFFLPPLKNKLYRCNPLVAQRDEIFLKNLGGCGVNIFGGDIAN